MAKNKVKKFNGGNAQDYRNYYNRKYFNLFLDSFRWTGIDYKAEYWIMTQFWDIGTVAAYKVKGLEGNEAVYFTRWNRTAWDIYNETVEVSLVPQQPAAFIPNKPGLVVGEDVVLGWIQRNRYGIRSIVDYYVDRIANIECVLNANLNLQKTPFLIPCSKEDIDKVNDIVDRIINNDIAITAEGIDPAVFKAVATGVPYLVDKLFNYKQSLENELKSYLSINNPGSEKNQQLQLAEVNANNAEVQAAGEGYLWHLQQFCKRINEAFGTTINVEAARPLEVEFEGQAHDGDQPGPKEEEE